LVIKPVFKNNKMTTLNKVIAKLIKNGNNVNDVKNMTNIHFEYASNKYTTVNSIANCIRTIY
jgi:hypothetical protein